jgi:hypothetical protein
MLIREWACTDDCGNKASHTRTVTVRDTTPPTLTRYPADVSVSCDCDDFPYAANVQAIDNCDNKVKVAYTEVQSGRDTDNYVLTRTWSATDDCGNSESWTQVVTVSDTEAPMLDSYPEDQTVSCDAVPDAEDIAAYDNCDETIVSVFTETSVSGSCADAWQVTRTWMATDRSGYSVSHSYNVVVEDNEAPALVADADYRECLYPADETYYVFEDASSSVATQVGDNCGSVTTSLSFCESSNDDGLASTDGFTDDCYYDSFADKLYVRASLNGGSSDRTYTVGVVATDECGNSATVAVSIYVPADERSVSGCDCQSGTVLNHP